MGFRAGVYGVPGMRDRDPHLFCDGCGVKREVTNGAGLPFVWHLERRSAPKWTADLSGDMRKDWCERCSKKKEQGR